MSFVGDARCLMHFLSKAPPSSFASPSSSTNSQPLPRFSITVAILPPGVSIVSTGLLKTAKLRCDGDRRYLDLSGEARSETLRKYLQEPGNATSPSGSNKSSNRKPCWHTLEVSDQATSYWNRFAFGLCFAMRPIIQSPARTQNLARNGLKFENKDNHGLV